jgi:hypothetical protein
MRGVLNKHGPGRDCVQYPTVGAPGAQTKKISRKEEIAMRKMIIISCGLLLLVGTFACATLGLAPKPLEPVILSSSGDFTSQPFEINTNEWQINWQYKSAGKRSDLFIQVYPAGDKVNWIEMVRGPRTPEGSGSTYLYQGKGSYYIKVRAKNLANWEIEVVRAGVSEPLASPATFAGNTDKTTKPFKIKGKEFKLTYAMETSGWAGQSIEVYPRGETEDYIDSSTVGPGTGSRVIQGSGEYYIKVQCPGVKSWKIDITE